MRRASVLLLIVGFVMGVSVAANAEMIISQNFDNTTTFPDEHVFTTSDATALGDAATTVAKWKLLSLVGDSGTSVTNDLYYSGTQSIVTERGTGDTPRGFGGLRTGTDIPIEDGILVAEARLRRNSIGGYLFFVGDNTTASYTDVKCPGASVWIDGNLKARYWNGSAWAYSANPIVNVPADTWVGLKYVIDLDNNQFDIWYDSGSGYTEIASDLAMESTLDVNYVGFNPNGTGNDSNPPTFWIDDVSLELVPEPSTLALLACGLIGLLAYAWRKRK
ncbi:MAG: PEP-CTERM sorting domain-containing protein [Pirellulales bacterium]|nr:PEP-CTERM sorting domain-containing protein [Pirellulales bacterium]